MNTGTTCVAAKSVASNISERADAFPLLPLREPLMPVNEGKTVCSGKELPDEATHRVSNLSLLSTFYGHKDLHASNTATRKLFQHNLKLFIFIVRK